MPTYAGRRVAVLDRPSAAPTHPHPVRPPALDLGLGLGLDLGEDTIERVLGALEPVDHTTSFADEPTARLPLLRVGSSVLLATAPAWETTTELPAVRPVPVAVVEQPPAALPQTQVAGKRRASHRATRRPPILRSLPSPPVLLGLAALAVSIGGTLTVHEAAASPTPLVGTRPASALSGTDATGHPGPRAGLTTRSQDRQIAAQPATASPLTSTANVMSARRTTALAKLDRKTAAYNKVLESNQWVTPVTPGVYHLTARFGQYGLWSSFHTGLDFAAPTGTPIHAIASGTVIFAQYDGAYGNKTIVRLADGTEIWYCHQNEFGTAVGDTVIQGDTIGYVGSTGHTTGPHVHIEVHPSGGDPVDPFPEFQQHGITP